MQGDSQGGEKVIRVCGVCGHSEQMPWDEWTGRMLEEPRCEECGTYAPEEHCEAMVEGDFEAGYQGCGTEILMGGGNLEERGDGFEEDECVGVLSEDY